MRRSVSPCKIGSARVSPPLLIVEDLTVERGGRVVLSSVNLGVHAGELTLVSGRNGAGKSTLMRVLAGLLAPTRGRVAFASDDGVGDEDAGDDARGVETVHYLGYEDGLKPTLTVGENLAFWAAMLGTPGPRPTPALSPDAALGAFGIGRLRDLPAAYLSAGQKRRVALARLLLAPRPIWLLDEPLIALDAAAQAGLAATMGDHLATGGAILLASHQPLALPHRTFDLDAALTAVP